MRSNCRRVYFAKYQAASRSVVSGGAVRKLMPKKLDWWARAIAARRDKLPFEERLWEAWRAK